MSGVNMPFSHDTQATLLAATALVNTSRRRDGVDKLATLTDLDRFYREHGYTGRFDRDLAELADVRGLRDRIGRLWEVERDDAVELINAMLVEGRAQPQLVRHDGWDWHLHVTHGDAPLAVQILLETAMAMVDVVRSEEFDRVRRCQGADCTAVLVDLSRNSSRRFCDVNNCANRAHVGAYRARRRAEGETG